MTKLIPPANPGWPDVTRFEVVDRLLGGDGGPLNRAPLELLERTEFLKKKLDDAVAGTLTLQYANQLKTARKLTMTGDGSWEVTFDGSGNVSGAMTLKQSVALTGTPTTPTPAPGTNTKQIVNAEFVQAAIAALVASSPGTLDTLNELAAALGNDPNFATTITNALAGKADKATTLAGYGITDAVSKTEIANAIPAGAVVHFAMSTAPAGWLKANGAAVSRTAYAALFAAIGTTYGAGDGAATFNLPDLRGEFIRGWDDGRGIDLGRANGSWQDYAIQSHVHTATADAQGAHSHGGVMRQGNDGSSAHDVSNVGNAPHYMYPGGSDGVGAHSHNVSIGATGGSETRPRNVALLACIKY